MIPDMIPSKVVKTEQRKELADILDKLAGIWYTNKELGSLLSNDPELETVKVKVSGLRVNRENYPISLKKLKPIMLKAKKLLKKIEEEEKNKKNPIK